MRILKRFLTPIGFFLILLLITLLFGMATLVIQFIYNEDQHFSSNSFKKIYIEVNQARSSDNIDYDFEKCKNLLQKNIEIKDLRRMKASYLNELKNIETKRNKLRKLIEQLQSKVDSYTTELNELKSKNFILKKEITNNLLKSSQINIDLKKNFDLIETIKTSRNYSLTIEDNSIVKNGVCTLEKCFDFSKCKLNTKLKLFIYNNNNKTNEIKTILNNLNLQQINRSLDISSDFSRLNESCLIVVFLLNKSNSQYYFSLTDFFLKHSLENNILLVDLNGEFSNKNNFMNYLSLSGFDSNIVKNFMFAGFDYLDSVLYNNLFIHFSFNPNFDYLNQHLDVNSYENAINKLNDRLYLFSFHYKNLKHDSLSGNKKIRFLQTLFESSKLNELKIKTDFECNSWKRSVNDTSLNLKADFDELCFDLNERKRILLNSTFTLLISSQEGFNWNNQMTIRLIEALKCSTIPVLIDSDLKIPLDDLISWDEVVIRIPFSRIKYMVGILASIDKVDLSKRRIKARNIYNSYFSTFTNQFSTLFAVVQHRLGLPPVSIPNFVGNELTYSYLMSRLNSHYKEDASSSNKSILYSYDLEIKNSMQSNIYYDDNDGQDDEEENDFEYLGQLNQKPLDSLEFKRNFTQDSYYLWNKFYYPFNLFPTSPFQAQKIIENEYIYEKISAIDYHGMDLKQNITLGGGDGKFFNHYLSGNFIEEQFTIVILTFKREKILVELLEKYVKLPYLNSIIIVWNSIDTEPTNMFNQKFSLYLSAKRIRIVKSVKNSLNNRFLPYSIISTDAILSLDDDVQLRPDEIMLAFRVWRENRDRIVGFPARYHTWNFNVNNYEYKSDHTCEYSMILTGAAFFHRFYTYVYSYLMDERIRNKIDEFNNCEDIAFNMMVSHFSRKPPIKVTCKWSFFCTECQSLNNGTFEQTPMSLRLDHYKKRTECIQYFNSIYGYNPLLYSQFRADSVLYKTKLPLDKKKCFKLV